MKRLKRVLAGLSACILILSATGCNATVVKDDVTKYPLVPALTSQEVIEYYAEALSFDAVITRNIEVSTVKYVTFDVKDEALKAHIEAAVNRTQAILNRMNYQFSEQADLALGEETFHYIKSFLNDKKLEEPNIVSIKQALGYYFVDVEYKLTSRSVGTFKPEASLLGLNGSFRYSPYTNTDKIDTAFLANAAEKLNEYYAESRILNKEARFDISNNLFSTIVNGEQPYFTDYVDNTVDDFGSDTEDDFWQSIDSNESLDTGDTDDIDDGFGVDTEDTDDIDDGFGADTEDTDIIQGENTNVTSIRHPGVDVDEFNSIAGSSLAVSAYMPDLSVVFETPKEEGAIGGIGIYNTGVGGLYNFGFDRENLEGTLTLRYVYKSDINNPSILRNMNVYPIFFEITTGFASNNDSIVPEFVLTELGKVIERADRAKMNTDMAAMMNGKIFADMGMAVLRGYESRYVNLLRSISTIRRVISRDVNNNAYLIEVETQRQEGPKGSDVYGTYRDISYVVIEQRGQIFVITDWLTLSRKMQIEPEINPDSAIVKRLIALNLAGEVTDTAKDEVNELVNSLYLASTHRLLEGEKTIKTGDKEIHLKKGMYDCFNRDPEMVPTTKVESINSKLRGILIKHGASVGATMNGVVTEWIGGADNLVEFTTEEIITYVGRSDGIYRQCYYLVSNMNDVWVIDDLQVIEQEEVHGEALQQILDRIGN